MIRTHALAGLIALCLVATCLAQEDPFEGIYAKSGQSYLLMPEPPAKYSVNRLPLEVQGKMIGFNVLVAKESPGTVVVIQVETSFDRSEEAARRAAYKGYVNGVAQGMRAKGFRLVKKTLPEPDKASYEKPIETQLDFENSTGEKFYARQFIFFTQQGYHVQVLGQDQDDVNLMTDWAKHIRPLAKE